MQEEVTGKSVALIISSAKMTEQVLDRAIRAYLDRKKQPKIYRGKQTLKQLAGQNAGLSNIEITEKNIRCFTQTAKKYHVDFALKKGYRFGAAPVSGVLQEPGRGCHYGSLPGIHR